MAIKLLVDKILNSSQNTEIALSSHPVFDVFLASYRKKFLEQVIEIYFTYNSYIINNMDNIIEKIYFILTLPPHLLRNNYIPPQRHVLPIPVFDVFLASYRKKFLEQVIEIYFTYNSYIINNMDNIIEKIYFILTLPPHLLRNNYIPPQRHVLPIPWYSP